MSSVDPIAKNLQSPFYTLSQGTYARQAFTSTNISHWLFPWVYMTHAYQLLDTNTESLFSVAKMLYMP